MIDIEEINRDPWSTYPIRKDDLRKLLNALHKCVERVEYLENLAHEVLEYFENYEDFEDGDYGVQQPNEEAYFADLIRRTLDLNTFNGDVQ
jgi:hypothetical protein